MNAQDILIGLLYTAGDAGIEEGTLLEVLDIPKDELPELIASYTSAALSIEQYGAHYFLAANAQLNPYIEQLVTKQVEKKLTQASMETLSIIAYNQPVTRNDIEAMRGVSSDGPVKTLIEKGLVESRQSDGRSQELFTSEYFLQVFGLKSLDELPSDDTEESQEEIDQFFKSMNDKGE